MITSLDASVVFITPDAATTTATVGTGSSRGPVDNLIDGITDSSSGQSVFFPTASNTFPVTISFEFNADQNVNGFRLWNGWSSPGNAIANFDLTFRDDMGAILDSFSGTGTQPVGIAAPTDFDNFLFSEVANVSTVDLTITTVIGAAGPEFREVAFSTTPVPEPSSTVLLGVFGLFLAGIRKRINPKQSA